MDYQWYYVLALRYGALSAVEFEGRATDSTGKLRGAVDGARGASRQPLPGALRERRERRTEALATLLAGEKARVYRASRFFQTLYRKYRMLRGPCDSLPGQIRLSQSSQSAL